jgi:uncharacterized repeat protein (TIGR01451 family)
MKKLNKNHIAALVSFFVLGFAGFAFAASTVSLGAADNFAVLAGSFITASTPSVISGDVGLSPAVGTFYTGLTTGMVTGTIYAVDATGPAGGAGNNPGLLTTAQNNLTTAYTTAAGQTPATSVLASSIDSFSGTGYTLTPGVYNSGSTMGITGTLTLDGGGDPNAVFVFQAGSSLTTASNSNIALINGAQACNVFWQVGSSATLGTGTQLSGNILAFSSITDNGGSTIQGRLLARNAGVTLNNTHVVKATCVNPPPAATVSSGSASYWVTLPLISVTKVPSPLSLPSGPGSVTYTYVVTNIGKVPLTTVWVQDDKCSPVQYVSGDINTNSFIDLTEAWTYRCTKTVSQTETNTATAHGYANSTDVYAAANATVVVGQSVVPPLIHVVKIPSVSVLPAGGGAVTYSYSVTNPGTAPLSDVSLIDNKCTGLPGRVVGHPGDLNKNNLLDPGETFQFTCQSNITQTTTNLATAEGTANGLTAIAFANATVVVAAPGLPNTGFPPKSESNPWNILITVGVFALVTGLAVVISRRLV